MTQLHLWRCPCLHSLGFCVHLGQRTWAYCLSLPLTGSPQEAAAQEIEVCPAKHLAFHHLEAIDVPFDWAGAPGQGDAGFDAPDLTGGEPSVLWKKALAKQQVDFRMRAAFIVPRRRGRAPV